MRISKTRSTRFVLLLTLFTLSACAGSDALLNPVLANSKSSTAQPLVIVIKDPRSERQLSNLTGPGYGAQFAYKDDPVLHRYASRIAKDHSLEIMNEWPLKNLGVHCFVVSGENSKSQADLEKDKRVLWVQPFNQFELKTDGNSAHISSTDIRNRFFSKYQTRGLDIRVAVVDTAADRDHPDLVNSNLRIRNYSGALGDPSSELHGTAVVGLIAATPQSTEGVRGIASEASTHLLRGCWQDKAGKGRCNTLTLALALDAAIALEPDVINLSLSGGQDRVLDELIKVLTENGTLVIAAFDENREPALRFPTPRPGVIYAYGLDAENTHSPRSTNVLPAPGHAVSLAPMSGYDLISGHSIAAPQLTAMAAVLMEHHKHESRSQIVTHLNNWLTEFYMRDQTNQD